MRVLITNDDGILAAGLQNIAQVVRGYDFVKEVWIVAPDRDKSCASHSMSFQKRVVVHKKSENEFAVEGTPVDCVIIAICDLMKNCKPDLIISGINMGANLDLDVFYSGTVSAAREGVLFGIPAIAISQFYYSSQDMIWQHNHDVFSDLLAELMQLHQDKRVFDDRSLLNINLPAKPVMGVKYLDQGAHHFGNHLEVLNEHQDGRSYIIGTKNLSVKSDNLQRGYITVTPLGVNLTNHDVLAHLKND